MAKRLFLILTSVLFVILPSAASFANPSPPKEKGLLVAPATSFVSANAGESKTGKLFVQNDDNKAISVALQVEQFNVNNYSYSYTFNDSQDNWVSLSQNSLNLAEGASQNVSYTINVPKNAKPGGYYLTLIASSVLGGGALKGTAQVASLLYLTVNGKLVHSSQLEGQGVGSIFFSRQINYHFNVLDTGNIYSFIYESAKLNGLGGSNSTTPEAHIIIPNKTRSISGSLEAPIWPGLYKITYGYTTSNGAAHKDSKVIVYIPPWSIAIVLAILLVINIIYGRRKNLKKSRNPDESS